MAERLRAQGAVRLSRAADVAGGSAPRQGAGAAGRRSSQGEPPLLPEKRAGGARAWLRRPRQRRAWRPRVRRSTRRSAAAKERSSCRPTPAGTRCRRARSGLPTAGAGLELTIDKYLQYIADRELRLGVEENNAAGGTRDHHGAADRRDPRARELADLQSRTTFARADADARRNRADPGHSTSPARRSRSSPRRPRSRRASSRTDRSRSTASPGYITFGPRDHPRHAPVRPAAVHRRDRQVEQRRRDQGRAAGRRRAPRAATSTASASARRSRPTSAARAAGIVWNPARLDAERARLGVDGLPGRRHAAADGDGGQLVANGGELVEPRVVRAFIQDGHRDEVPHKVLRRTITPETAATLTEIMEAVVERGTAQEPRRSTASPLPARRGRRRSSSTAITRSRTTTRRSSGSSRRASRR